LNPGRKDTLRAFRPQIEGLRDQISCYTQSEAVTDKPTKLASIEHWPRVDDERIRTMRSFCYRFACKQNVALHIHRGAQSTRAYVDCQHWFNRCDCNPVRGLRMRSAARRV